MSRALRIALVAFAAPLAGQDMPDASNTGHITPFAELVTYTGPSTITVDGTVIEGVYFPHGTALKIQANNVTIRDFYHAGTASADWFSGGIYSIQATYGATGLLIEYGIFDRMNSAGFFGGGGVVRHCELQNGGNDAFKPTDDLEIVSNWIHSLGQEPGSHADGVQMVQGDNVHIRYNRFGPQDPGTKINQMILTMTNNGPLTDVVVEENWLEESIYPGGVPVQIRDKAPPGGTGLQPEDCRFVRNRFFDSTGAVWTISNAWNGSGTLGSDTLVAGNLDHETGALVSGQVAEPAGWQLPSPTASPAAQAISSPVQVSLAVAGGSAPQIHYTLDGTTPTSADPVYSSALTISAGTVLRFVAIDGGSLSDSPVMTAAYPGGGEDPPGNDPDGAASAASASAGSITIVN